MIIDCADFIGKHPKEQYAHEYDNYLNFFRTLAYADAPVICDNVPPCWVPLVLYLGHTASTQEDWWDSDSIDWRKAWNNFQDKRRIVEISSACRPELVHSLYCVDTEWPCPLRKKQSEKEFLVTCNGSFFRDEVLEYGKRLQEFVPTKRKCVLVPCAAIKPYPAPLHKEVLKRLPSDWHLITATGVLGLVPQELWDEMPLYDSGLPNLFRCRETVAWYFSKHIYQNIVVYSDFYASAIHDGLSQSSSRYIDSTFVLGHHYRDTYENLLLAEHLMALERAICERKGLAVSSTVSSRGGGRVQ